MPNTGTGEKMASLTNGTGGTGYPHVEWNHVPITHLLQKINSKRIKGLNIRHEAFKTLKKNRQRLSEKDSHHLEIIAKTDILGHMKLKSLCPAQKTRAKR